MEARCSSFRVCTSPDSVSALPGGGYYCCALPSLECVPALMLFVIPASLLPRTELNQLTGIAALLTFPLDIDDIEEQEEAEQQQRLQDDEDDA